MSCWHAVISTGNQVTSKLGKEQFSCVYSTGIHAIALVKVLVLL